METTTQHAHQAKETEKEEEEIPTVMRTFTLPMLSASRQDGAEIVKRIKSLQGYQDSLLTYDSMKVGYEVIQKHASEYRFQRHLCKAVGHSPNIAQSAYHWGYIALKGKLDKEKKVRKMLSFFQDNVQQALEFVIFGRSPHTESTLSKYYSITRSYVVNLVHSTRRQADSYWRKHNTEDYDTKHIKFNDTLPQTTTKEVSQAIVDAYKVKKYDFTSQKQEMTKNQELFLKKLRTLVTYKDSVADHIVEWINSPQQRRWTSLKKLSIEIAAALGTRYRRLFSAIRQIVVFTLFNTMLETVPQLLDSLPVAKIVPLPFKQKKKGKRPVLLMMKHTAVIPREGNSVEMTAKVIKRMKQNIGQNCSRQELDAREEEFFSLFNKTELESMCTPPSKKKGYKFSPKSPLTKLLRAESYSHLGFPKGHKSKRKNGFPLFPKKVCEYLQKGVTIRTFQVSTTYRPSVKPRIQVILEGDVMAFHSNKLLHEYMAKIPQGDTQTIGVDINRIGEYMVRYNVPINIPADLVKLAQRWEHQKEVNIPTLQHAQHRAKRRKEFTHAYKHESEIKKCHKRARDLLHELTTKLSFWVGAVVINHKAKELRIEDLRIDPRGTKGALAKAIYSMPNAINIYKKAVWLASLELGYKVKLIAVSPYGTSSIHHGCGGTLQRTKGKYDSAPCAKCGEFINTHDNAALNIASRYGHEVDISPFSLHALHVREGTEQ